MEDPYLGIFSFWSSFYSKQSCYDKIVKRGDLHMELNKKKKSLLIKYIVIGVLCLAVGFASGYFVFHTDTQKNNNKTNTGVIDEVIELLNNNWLDTTDSKTSMQDRMLQGLVDGLGDSHSSYMSAQENKSFNNDINGNYSGIGVYFSPVHSGALLTGIIEGSSAQKAGLQAGDIITKAKDQSLKGLTSTQMQSYIKGNENTKVSLEVKRDQQTFHADALRKSFSSDVTYYAGNANNKTYGYINISTFGDTTAQHVETALKQFKKQNVSDIILDLRGNGGGYITAARDLLSLFNEKGETLFTVKNKKGQTETYKDNTKTHYAFANGYILMNGGTASASELCAGVFKEIQGYKLIGEKSYGKGTIQAQTSLTDGSVLKYTYAKWYTPNGVNINKKGWDPDINVQDQSLLSVYFTYYEDKYYVGNVSNTVMIMETLLNDLGYDPGRTDGYFSQGASDALKRFEQDHGLTVDGVLEYSDQECMVAALAEKISLKENDQTLQKTLSLL